MWATSNWKSSFLRAAPPAVASSLPAWLRSASYLPMIDQSQYAAGKIHSVSTFKGHLIRDTFWRLVKFLGKIRDILVLGNNWDIFTMKLPYNEATFRDTTIQNSGKIPWCPWCHDGNWVYAGKFQAKDKDYPNDSSFTVSSDYPEVVKFHLGLSWDGINYRKWWYNISDIWPTVFSNKNWPNKRLTIYPNTFYYIETHLNAQEYWPYNLWQYIRYYTARY